MSEQRPVDVNPLPAPDLLGDELVALIPAIAAGAGPAPATPATPPALRARLFDRVARSAAASRDLFTLRHADAPLQQPQPGLTLRTLYRARGLALRPGEPARVRLIELAPGACWDGPEPDLQREWLVMRGAVRLGDEVLEAEDFHVAPAGAPARPLAGAQGAHGMQGTHGALVMLRESPLPAGRGEQPRTQHARDAAWLDFAPGIRRRLMWQRGREAAMLYRAAPGVGVPRHGHGHDEECLMLAGDLFLDEVLLRTLDYQLAPAGSVHASVFTDTGALLYAHGDVELDLMPG